MINSCSTYSRTIERPTISVSVGQLLRAAGTRQFVQHTKNWFYCLFWPFVSRRWRECREPKRNLSNGLAVSRPQTNPTLIISYMAKQNQKSCARLVDFMAQLIIIKYSRIHYLRCVRTKCQPKKNERFTRTLTFVRATTKTENIVRANGEMWSREKDTIKKAKKKQNCGKKINFSDPYHVSSSLTIRRQNRHHNQVQLTFRLCAFIQLTNRTDDDDVDDNSSSTDNKDHNEPTRTDPAHSRSLSRRRTQQ